MQIWSEKHKKLGKIWRANFVHKGKRHRPKAFTKDDLLDLIAAIRTASERTKYGLSSLAPKITLDQALTEHFKELNLETKNGRRTKTVLESFRKKVGNIAIANISTSDLRLFVRWRKDAFAEKTKANGKQKQLKPESINKELGMISSFLRACRKYFRQLDDYTPPRIPWSSVPKGFNDRRIRPDEINTLLNHFRFGGLLPNENPSSRLARFEYADLFEMALNTCCRWGEIVALRWTQIDLIRGEIYLKTGETKTDKNRVVYLNSRAVEILTARKLSAKSKFVFPNPKGDGHRKYYLKGIKRACAKLNLPFGRDVEDGFTLHTTRHTAASIMLEKTGDFAAVQSQLGHSDKTMTAKYAHTEKSRMIKAVEHLVIQTEGIN